MPLEIDEYASAIQQILSDKLLVEVDSMDADLLQAGLLDSLALIQLLVHLEERFGVKVSVDELEIEDLRSIHSVARMIARQKEAKKAASAEQNGVPVHG
ncbi:MAG TPA: phosphopantetheine-binding protein [Bryobacteraceae bacterium]|jgi:D-alanine--poly(phosphoribitol) ligase subunit 2|nr:phosphopantetheine-binding protein [Bryobacteraceae bacterium]